MKVARTLLASAIQWLPRPSSGKLWLAVALVQVTLPPEWAGAELTPDQIAIVTLRSSRESRELAAYYAQARGIPESQICIIDAPPGQVLPRETWEKSVRPGIRAWIAENELQYKLKCLVTTWDVPLKIGRSSENAVNAERTKYLESERLVRVQRLMQTLADVARLGAEEPVLPAVDEDPPIAELQQMATTTFEAAKGRVNESSDGAFKQRSFERLLTMLGKIGGAASLSTTLASQQTADPRALAQRNQQIQHLNGQVAGLRDGQIALAMLPESVERDQQMLSLMEKGAGLLGTLRWIDQQLPLIKKNETYSSFDSELSLLYWPDYPLLRWAPNVLHHQFDGSDARWLQTTLMVARLEAPTLELTRKLIDTAIEIERTGLDGKFYLDARGLGKPKPGARGSYADYDQSVRDLAEFLEAHTDRKVVLDNEAKLFQSGDCPQTGLYCGWYSLSKYVDAFQWNRGAVGYHMASGEAATLRDPKSQVWCKRMLEEGVCATVGPVYEPYLAAFPRPDEFFPLLLSGRYTLVETYYRTKPFNSWVMVLVGDPLYRPFRDRPAFRLEELPKRYQRLIAPKDGEQKQPATTTKPGAT